MSGKRDISISPVGVQSYTGHIVHLLAAGLLLALSFPPIGWWPVAYIALVPIGVLAARSARGGRLFVTAWAVFFLWWAFMVRWVVAVHVLAVVGIAAVVALYVAAACWALWWLHRRYRAAMTLALPMAWISSEYLRGMFPIGGFAWLSLGHTQAASFPGQSPGWIVQTADLFGEHTVGFLVAMTSGLIVDLLTRPLMRPGARGLRRVRKTIRAAVVLWLLAFVAALIYGRSRLIEAPTAGGPRIAVIQTSVPHDNKIHRTAEQDAADFADMMQQTRRAAQMSPRPDVIVWPETMTPAALNPEATTTWAGPAAYHEQVSTLARQLETPLLVGAPTWIGEPDAWPPRHRANSAFLYYADGARAVLRYDKQHLVPFGEYLPIISSSARIKQFYLDHISPYPQDYSLRPGQAQTVFELPLGNGSAKDGASADPGPLYFRLVTPICYEDVVGRVVRRLVYDDTGGKRADVVVNLTNSAWYRGGGMRRQHLQIAVFRAIENRVPVARAVNSGISGFISADGAIGPVLSEGEPGEAAAVLNLDPRVTVYGRIGATPFAGIAIATGLLILGGGLRHRGRRRREADKLESIT